MKDDHHILFCKGNTYYLGVNMAPRADQTLLDYDNYQFRGISDGQFAELEFVEKEGRTGIFILRQGNEYTSEYLYEADAFPFIYDEVWMPCYTGYEDVYLAARIGRKWGVLRLKAQGYNVQFKGWCVPWNYDSRKAAISAIRARYDLSQLRWTPAFCEAPWSFKE